MVARLAEAIAGPGHNNPPATSPLLDRLKEDHADALATVERVAQVANQAPAEVTDDAIAAVVTDIAADAGKLRKKLDGVRTEEKAPFLTKGREVDDFFRSPIDRLDRIDKALMGRVTAYNRRKAAVAARIANEEAERQRKAAEAARMAAAEAAKLGRTDDALAELGDFEAALDAEREAIKAAPTAAEATRLQTDGGVTLSTRTEWTFEIVDHAKLDLEAIRPFLKPDAIEAAIRQFVKINKGARQIAGVRIFEELKATRR